MTTTKGMAGGPPRGERLRRTLGVIAVAFGATAFAVLFRGALEWFYESSYAAKNVVDGFRTLPGWARVLTPAVGGLLAGFLVTRASRSEGDGVSQVMEAVVFGRSKLSLRSTAWKALGSWIAIGSGGSIGREGPLVQFGGSLGNYVARVSGLGRDSSRVLVAAGTAAGFAAAYNTPFAAALFVLEVVTGVVVLDAMLPVMVAVALATLISRSIVGGGPIYGERDFALSSPGEFIALGLLAAFCGLGAQLFMRSLSRAEKVLQASPIRQPWRAGLGGLVVGVTALHLPEVTGNGYEPLNELLDGQLAVKLVIVLFFAKAIATIASVATGSPGGVFTPTMFLGGALGVVAAHGAGTFVAGPWSEGSYVLVGMAAMVAATTHAPLMASVMAFELSGDYAIVLPLVFTTAIATMISRRARTASIYTAPFVHKGIEWRVGFEGRLMAEREQASVNEPQR